MWGVIMQRMLLKWGMRLTGKRLFYFTISPAHGARGGDIAFPRGTDDCHHEVEMVVALQSGGKDIAPEKAMSCVYGYGVGLDMTRRDLQAAAKDKKAALVHL